MTTKNETAAYVAASIIAPMGFKSVLEGLKAWEQVYDAVLDKMGPEPAFTGHTYTTGHTHTAAKQERVTEGGRRMPIVDQETIQEKIAEVFVAKGRIIPVRSGELPADAQKWATDRGFTHLYDNRWAQKENPKRPAFKAVDEKGNDIKDENGKSMSFWGDKR